MPPCFSVRSPAPLIDFPGVAHRRARFSGSRAARLINGPALLPDALAD
jgi:hypothetical protein